MLSSPANQRRSPRNRRNRTQAPNRNLPRQIPFSPKLKYENSFTNDDGVYVLSKRKRMPLSAEEKERRKRKRIVIDTKKILLLPCAIKCVICMNMACIRTISSLALEKVRKSSNFCNALIPNTKRKRLPVPFSTVREMRLKLVSKHQTWRHSVTAEGKISQSRNSITRKS